MGAKQEQSVEPIVDPRVLLDAVSRCLMIFVDRGSSSEAFELMLGEMLALTCSEYGFIGEVLFTTEGQPYLRTHAISNIAWNEQTRALYLQRAPNLEFRNLKSLFGVVMTSGAPVIANDPATDPRSGGTPPGHPPLRHFLGLPVQYAHTLVGMVGIANRPGGYEEPLVSELSPLLAACGHIINAHRVYQQRGRLEAERDALLHSERAARAEAERASCLKDDFLAVISHELRTPLHAILGWTRVLLSGHLPEERQARALETIERNARNQEDLLDVSRITSGKLRLDMTPVEPSHVVEAALEAVGPAAEAQGLRLETTLDPRAGPVLGDPDRLQQIVWNLLSNAVKFTPRGGEIRISLTRTGSSVEIAVADTGQGIRAEFLPHVFERFRQGDASPTRAHSGLGLGLAIVHHLVALHGGTIRAESEGEHRGATFAVQLPLAPVLSNMSAQRSKSRALLLPFDRQTSLAGLRILVVDDEEDARTLLVSILEQSNAETETAASALEALEQVRRRPPDVILSDIAMPGEDGLTLIRKIRALLPEQGGRIAALAITALARVEDRTGALRAGFNLHLPKPVDPAELIVAIANVTGRLSA
jgi:signal transduction histidine kinase/ActR/RegA family two-component response regulator